MFRRLGNGWRHTTTILRALPAAHQRALLQRMITFSRNLPHQFNQPLPVMMAELTPVARSRSGVSVDNTRRLADAVAAWHVRSALGICLRRSLLRYYFLREAGEPVTIVFGARFKTDSPEGGIGGHAWLTLGGEPYFENPKDIEGFVNMYVYPEA